MPPLRDDQYISLSPTDSPGDDAETDLGAAALGPASQGGCRQVGKGLTRMPAVTPRTPPFWPDFQRIQMVESLRHPLRAFSHVSAQILRLSTHSIVSAALEWGTLHLWSLNAGLIVIFRSSHPPLFDWNAWSLRFRSSPGSVTDEGVKEEASRLAMAFWGRIGEFVMRSRTASELSPEENSVRFGYFAFDGHVSAVLFGLLPGMGIDW